MRPADEVLGAVGFSVLAVRPGDTCVTMGVSDLTCCGTFHLSLT
jgi:fluoroacetyl-CoA thioesterase